MKTALVAIAIGAFMAAAPAAHANPIMTNILKNGSFETGDFTGWTLGGNFQATSVASGPFDVFPGAQDGAFYVVSGAQGEQATLSQTVKDRPNGRLFLFVELFADRDIPSSFSVFVDLNSATFVNPKTDGSWFRFFATMGSTGLDTFTIGLRDDVGFVAIDNVVVSEGIAEPLSLALFGSGLAAIGCLTRRGRYPQPQCRAKA